MRQTLEHSGMEVEVSHFVDAAERDDQGRCDHYQGDT